jgi:hypothetical protein
MFAVVGVCGSCVVGVCEVVYRNGEERGEGGRCSLRVVTKMMMLVDVRKCESFFEQNKTRDDEPSTQTLEERREAMPRPRWWQTVEGRTDNVQVPVHSLVYGYCKPYQYSIDSFDAFDY